MLAATRDSDLFARSVAADWPRLELVDLGAPARRAAGALGALLAPLAMGMGALGLLGLWTLAPHSPDAAAPPPRPAFATAALPGPAVSEPPLGRFLVELGAPALAPSPLASLTPIAGQADAQLRTAQAALISAADQTARARLASAGATVRATGLDPRAYMNTEGAAKPLPARTLKDPRALAARLEIDPTLARQAQQAVRDLVAARALDGAVAALPLAIPVNDPVRSSSFGVRVDPFTHIPAFHPGQDFSGRYGEAIHVTAPGVVSFVGQRTGYGNVVEVDHGYGFKTRYGHLSRFVVGVGTPVKTGDVIGRMGSTGRSTGVHLHYEVWASGHLENPVRFLVGPEPARQG